NLVLAGKRSGIVGPPYVNWNEETIPEGAQTPAGWPEGHNKSSTSPQPEDPKSPPKSPSSPPAINLGESSSSSEPPSDHELPNQTLEPPPLQHQTTLQRTRSGQVTQPPLPYWIANNIAFKQSKFDTTIRDAPRPVQDSSPSSSSESEQSQNSESAEEGVVATATAQLGSSTEPKTLNSAKSRPDWPEWEVAVQEALDSLKENPVWNEVDRPKGRKVVDSIWVFKIKHNADGSIDRYKARLVAKGFTQIKGLDFDETFSPVVRYDTLRLLLALSAHHNWTPR